MFNRDTYSYMWPRDGALVAYGLDRRRLRVTEFLHLVREHHREGRAISSTNTRPLARWRAPGTHGSKRQDRSCRSKRMRRRWSSGPFGTISSCSKMSSSSALSTSDSSNGRRLHGAVPGPKTGLPRPATTFGKRGKAFSPSQSQPCTEDFSQRPVLPKPSARATSRDLQNSRK